MEPISPSNNLSNNQADDKGFDPQAMIADLEKLTNTPPPTSATAPVSSIPPAPSTANDKSAPTAVVTGKPQPEEAPKKEASLSASTGLASTPDLAKAASAMTNPQATVDNGLSEPALNELEEKIRLAKLAMEGPERTAKREKGEKEKEIIAEKNKLQSRLAEIDKEKEKLEIAWIDMDQKRAGLKGVINPILEKEKLIETEEAKLEETEAHTLSERDKQAYEKKRAEIETKRQAVEKEKWSYEESLWKIEDEIKVNTTKYQTLLDEEEQLNNKIEDLDQQLI